jgi:hypothetical protein
MLVCVFPFTPTLHIMIKHTTATTLLLSPPCSGLSLIAVDIFSKITSIELKKWYTSRIGVVVVTSDAVV